MPFFSHVAARNNSGSLARMDDRAVVGRYLGAARGCGVGAIHVLVDRHPRVVRSFKYLAPPNAEYDTRALAPFGPARPPPTPTPAPTPEPSPTTLPTTLPTMLPMPLPTPLPTPQPSPYVSTATSGDVAFKVLQDNPKRPGTVALTVRVVQAGDHAVALSRAWWLRRRLSLRRLAWFRHCAATVRWCWHRRGFGIVAR